METVLTSLMDLNLCSNCAVIRRICSALVIITIIGKLIKRSEILKYDISLVISLFSMLRILPFEDDSPMLSSELAMISEFLKPEGRRVVSKTLADYANFICQHQNLQNPEWLYVLPLLHIINSVNTQVPSSRDGNYNWKDNLIHLRQYDSLGDAKLNNMK